MSTHRLSAITLALLASSACAFNRSPAVEVSALDATLNTTWHANLASPPSLAGAVQMRGSASMGPGTDGTGTVITINLANASPGGLHPWEARMGQCGLGMDYGAFGDSEAFKTLEVKSDGQADATAMLPQQTPTSGGYFAVVYASAANDRTVVACGNLAAPTR